DLIVTGVQTCALPISPMFEGWENFFLMVGGAAAVLIGLIYVVISLMHDRPRSSVLAGSRLYMGPIVLGVSFVLILSAAALTPGVERKSTRLNSSHDQT